MMRRRRFLALPALGSLACVNLPQAQAPADWVEVGFGRYTIHVPPAVLGNYEVDFSYGPFSGKVVSCAEAADSRWRYASENATNKYEFYSNEPDQDASKIEQTYEDHTILAVFVEHEDQSRLNTIDVKSLTGEPQLYFRSVDSSPTPEASLRETKSFLDRLHRLPVSTEFADPFRLPHHVIDSSGAFLGQWVSVIFRAGSEQLIEFEYALVSEPKSRELGAQRLANLSLRLARAGDPRAGAKSLMLRARRVTVEQITAPERVWTTAEDDVSTYHAAWTYLGRAQDAQFPFLSVYYGAAKHTTSRAGFLSDWDSLLQSLRFAPKHALKSNDSPL